MSQRLLAAALLLAAAAAAAAAAPLPHHAGAEGAVAGAGARHATLADAASTRHAAHADAAERLPLPSPQELQAIRKVAQILIMLGDQVIPAILGEQQLAECEPAPAPPAAPPVALLDTAAT